MDNITKRDIPGDAKEVKIDVQHVDAVAPAARNLNIYHGLAGKFVPLHITKIISIIAENYNEETDNETPDTVPFDIQRKIEFNELEKWDEIIHEFAFHQPEVEKIYEEYDRMARNTSTAVFHWLRYQIYFQLRKKYSGDDLFDEIANKVLFLVQNDPEYHDEMGLEILTENVYIVLVHAFMKCKIFKKPVEVC